MFDPAQAPHNELAHMYDICRFWLLSSVLAIKSSWLGKMSVGRQGNKVGWIRAFAAIVVDRRCFPMASAKEVHEIHSKLDQVLTLLQRFEDRIGSIEERLSMWSEKSVNSTRPTARETDHGVPSPLSCLEIASTSRSSQHSLTTETSIDSDASAVDVDKLEHLVCPESGPVATSERIASTKGADARSGTAISRTRDSKRGRAERIHAVHKRPRTSEDAVALIGQYKKLTSENRLKTLLHWLNESQSANHEVICTILMSLSLDDIAVDGIKRTVSTLIQWMKGGSLQAPSAILHVLSSYEDRSAVIDSTLEDAVSALLLRSVVSDARSVCQYLFEHASASAMDRMVSASLESGLFHKACVVGGLSAGLLLARYCSDREPALSSICLLNAKGGAKAARAGDGQISSRIAAIPLNMRRSVVPWAVLTDIRYSAGWTICLQANPIHLSAASAMYVCSNGLHVGVMRTLCNGNTANIFSAAKWLRMLVGSLEKVEQLPDFVDTFANGCSDYEFCDAIHSAMKRVLSCERRRSEKIDACIHSLVTCLVTYTYDLPGMQKVGECKPLLEFLADILSCSQEYVECVVLAVLKNVAYLHVYHWNVLTAPLLRYLESSLSISLKSECTVQEVIGLVINLICAENSKDNGGDARSTAADLEVFEDTAATLISHGIDEKIKAFYLWALDTQASRSLEDGLLSSCALALEVFMFLKPDLAAGLDVNALHAYAVEQPS